MIPSRHLSIVLALAASACGDDASQDGGQGGASASTTSEGPSSSSIASGGGDPTGGGGAESQAGAGGSFGEPTRAATVWISNLSYAEYPEYGEVGTFYGAFGQELVEPTPDERESLGDCFFASREVDLYVPPGVELVEMDQLEVEGTLVPVTPAREANGTYLVMVEEPLLAPRLEVRFTGTGVDAPTIDVTLAAPSRLSLLGPDLSGGLDRGADAIFTWDVVGDAGGDVGLTIDSERQEGSTTVVERVDCFVPIEAGELVVPVAFLERLQGDRAFLSLGAMKVVETQVEDWLIYFGLGHFMIHADLRLVGGPVE